MLQIRDINLLNTKLQIRDIDLLDTNAKLVYKLEQLEICLMELISACIEC